MRGKDTQQSAMFSYISAERRVPANHPLRPIRAMVDMALKGLSRSFGQMYPDWGRPSIAPEELLRALLLQLLYSIRSERLLMEQQEYNLLFRWFVGLNVDEPVWVATVFSKNRDRLLEGEIAAKFFAQVLDQARANDLLSDEHFSVDGTLIEAWASQKSFQRKEDKQAPPPEDPGNPTVNFHGEKRSNDRHQSTTDPEARLARKGSGHESKLAYCANVLIENRPNFKSAADAHHRNVPVQAATRPGISQERCSTRRSYPRREPCSHGVQISWVDRASGVIHGGPQAVVVMIKYVDREIRVAGFGQDIVNYRSALLHRYQAILRAKQKQRRHA
jgi:transposase